MSTNVHVRGCLSRLGPNFVPAFRVSVNAKKKIYIYIYNVRKILMATA